jgi:hypothetical protein
VTPAAAHPEIDIVQGHIQKFHRAGSDDWLPSSAPYRYISIASALFRRSVFDTVGTDGCRRFL